MARTADDIEAYLGKLQRHFERVNEATFLVAVASDQPPIALRVSPPVVVFQVEIGEIPEASDQVLAPLYRRLLELNVEGLMHAAFGIAGKKVQLTSALELDNLDINELEAVLADMSLAIAQHVGALRALAKNRA